MKSLPLNMRRLIYLGVLGVGTFVLSNLLKGHTATMAPLILAFLITTFPVYVFKVIRHPMPNQTRLRSSVAIFLYWAMMMMVLVLVLQLQ